MSGARHRRMSSRVIALGAIGALALGLVAGLGWPALSSRSVNLQRPSSTFADPNNRSAGTLNAAAVQEIQAEARFPVLWLGESFSGYSLTSYKVDYTTIPAAANGTGEVDAWMAVIIYGACDPSRDKVNHSCPPPLELVISAPGIVPDPNDPSKWGPGLHPETAPRVRGALAIPVSLGTLLRFDNGYAVTVYADAAVQAQVIEALTIANGVRFGVPAVAAGADLSVVATLPVAPVRKATAAP